MYIQTLQSLRMMPNVMQFLGMLMRSRISECLDRYDTVGSGGGAEFVDTSDGVEGGHDLDGGGDDQTVEEDMAKLLEE
jgi:hypothetical protein